MQLAPSEARRSFSRTGQLKGGKIPTGKETLIPDASVSDNIKSKILQSHNITVDGLGNGSNSLLREIRKFPPFLSSHGKYSRHRQNGRSIAQSNSTGNIFSSFEPFLSLFFRFFYKSSSTSWPTITFMVQLCIIETVSNCLLFLSIFVQKCYISASWLHNCATCRLAMWPSRSLAFPAGEG